MTLWQKVAQRRTALRAASAAVGAVALAAGIAPAVLVSHSGIAAVDRVATVSAAATATETSQSSLKIVGGWSRATAPGASVGVAYFEIVNGGPADALTAIDCPLARRVEMHSTATVDGLMQMRQTQSVDVPAGGRVAFKPSGLHAMLIDLKQPLKEGERLPLTLVFRHAGRIRVDALILGLGAMAAPGAQ